MSFLDNIGKAAQGVAKKSSELVEVTKLNMAINSEEDKIQKTFNQIGKMVYEKFKAEGVANPEFHDLCQAVRTNEETIKSLKGKILEVKNLKVCVSCGVEMESAAMFCVKCGSKQPETAVPQQAPTGPACTACGAPVPAGAAFCTKCGAKIG